MVWPGGGHVGLGVGWRFIGGWMGQVGLFALRATCGRGWGGLLVGPHERGHGLTIQDRSKCGGPGAHGGNPCLRRTGVWFRVWGWF
jgi:hypothetical protein